MDLVLLPHHNTITSLQNLQKELGKLEEDTFLAAYPLVCVLGHTDEIDVHRGKLECKPLQLLKDMLMNTGGAITFTDNPEFDERIGMVQIPVCIPFLDKIKDAGFFPESKPRIQLGRLFSEQIRQSTRLELPPTSRSFRIALMETKPLSAGSTLSEAEPAAFTWKFHLPFWVKLR